jgi:hypothetical protein
MESVTLKNTPLSPFLDALLEDPALATSRETASSSFKYYYGDDDVYPRGSYSCDFDSDDSNCAGHREPFPLLQFPAQWLLEIGNNFGHRNEHKAIVGKLMDLVKRRPKNHGTMEMIVQNSTNFTEDALDEIRRAAPELEINWDCREDMESESESESEGDTQSDPESEEDANTDDETDVDRESQDWPKYMRNEY